MSNLYTDKEIKEIAYNNQYELLKKYVEIEECPHYGTLNISLQEAFFDIIRENNFLNFYDKDNLNLEIMSDFLNLKISYEIQEICGAFGKNKRLVLTLWNEKIQFEVSEYNEILFDIDVLSSLYSFNCPDDDIHEEIERCQEFIKRFVVPIISLTKEDAEIYNELHEINNKI